MSNWSHGYNVEQGYTYGAYREMSPEWLDFVARLQGFVPPDRTSEFRYLELGTGQGLGLCILAACYPEGEFVGVDFKPAHISHAKQLAQRAGLTNVRFVEADFSELACSWPNNFGQFNYVALHGIYTWVPVPIRHALVRCIQHAALPGALIYNSYNALPGWTTAYPMQHLLRRMQLVGGGRGESAIQKGIERLLTFEQAGASIFKALPGLKSRLEKSKTQNRAYLVQEYLHDHWQPMWFSQVASEMADAKLDFVGSASIFENEYPSALPDAQRDVILHTDDPILQQELIDSAVNQGFRRDVFGRGLARAFGAPSLPDVSLQLAGPLLPDTTVNPGIGDFTINDPLRSELNKAMTDQPQSLAALSALPAARKAGGPSFRRAIVVLLHGQLVLLQRSRFSSNAAARLNSAIASQVAQSNAPYSHLAAAALGACFGVAPMEMALLHKLYRDPDIKPASLATELHRELIQSGRQVLQNGNPITDSGALQSFFQKQAEEFITRTAPRWKKIGIVP